MRFETCGTAVLTINSPRELSKYPQLNQFEQQTSVPKVYVVLGLAVLYFALIFFNIAGEFLVNVAGFIIPAFYSLDALFSTTKADDTQWLTVCDYSDSSSFHSMTDMTDIAMPI
jgi:hypothetical protein